MRKIETDFGFMFSILEATTLSKVFLSRFCRLRLVERNRTGKRWKDFTLIPVPPSTYPYKFPYKLSPATQISLPDVVQDLPLTRSGSVTKKTHTEQRHPPMTTLNQPTPTTQYVQGYYEAHIAQVAPCLLCTVNWHLPPGQTRTDEHTKALIHILQVFPS